MVNPTLKQEIIQLQADFWAALSDPTRILNKKNVYRV
jgi:hypothetical protein